MKDRFVYVLLILGSLLFFATPALSLNAFDSCMLKAIQNASSDMTIGELKAECRKEQAAVQKNVTETDSSDRADKGYTFSNRLKEDEKNILRPFSLMAHKPNYILFGAYNHNGFDPSLHQEQYSNPSLSAKHVESQFQLSIKSPLVVDLFKQNIDIYAAYTNLSFWQVYNSEFSSPFREINHEPEAWIQFNPAEIKAFAIKNSRNRIGFVHQSNGKGGILSRSWNRVYLSMLFEKNNFTFSIKPWLRIPEDAENDDNPNITDYLGHYHVRFGYKLSDHTFSMMLRNNLESGFSKGAMELGWSFPLWKYNFIKGYVHYFSGYGHSLIDYDNYINSIGVGVLLTDIL
ncbi:MAG TPA: phospholipase [Desulfocapsa sulfexigens]|nr:phospholipase [Desulfocapsa sulfexigens]